MHLVGKRIPGLCCDGTILFVDGDGTMFVEFDNGDEALVFVRNGQLHTQCYRQDRFARPERSKNLYKGQRVLASWEPQWFYAGTVRFVNPRSGRAYIRFDDGDRGIKKPDQIKAMEICAGAHVECQMFDGASFRDAQITRRQGDLVYIVFEDRSLHATWVPWSEVRVAPQSIAHRQRTHQYCFSKN